ncbi:MULTISPECIES: hypothetical protein [Subtercola]|uniref:Uncharacterized protein n=1 Tax=Subtercola vilae TaxID=2056433 RepID=A0A4V4RG57_9MICO|nr:MULTISPECIES: hypothetical protein [Subtercola]MEA9986437.1 hypothetical protein [Subtercola sp. RTI3]TIH40384.1 hypothetical protein D4765_02185 [Subtercola vilae]
MKHVSDSSWSSLKHHSACHVDPLHNPRLSEPSAMESFIVSYRSTSTAAIRPVDLGEPVDGLTENDRPATA